jgi:hypothetical protein
MHVQSTLIIVYTCVYLSEIEVNDEICIMLWRRILANVQSTEEGLKLVLLVDVVVMFEHGEGEALAKTARANIEEVHIGVFYIFDEWGLVYIVTIPLPNILKVLHAVWYALAIDSLFSFSYSHGLNVF